MTKFVLYSDIVESNGRAIRANLEQRHNIPLGTLVQVELDEDFGDGGFIRGTARLWVGSHTRDSDGTPLYTLMQNLWAWNQTDWSNNMLRQAAAVARCGYSEESLVVVES
jgi:hypothetical protein